MVGGEVAAATSLAPGFRFHPTDEEIVCYYLKRKICGKSFRFDAIAETDIYRSEPWDLPDKSRLKSRDLEWYFFSALDKKYGNGWRTNRATEQGYWKTTGKDRPIQRGNRTVGMKKTLVYHIGRAPRGERTNWVMHEYKLADKELEQTGVDQDAIVLCRIFQKSGTGPKNGEQYGAPFIEEEWDEDELVPGTEACGGGGMLCGLGHEESIQQQQNVNEQNLPLEIPPLDAALPMASDGGNGWNIVEDPMRFLENDQNLFTGSGETGVLPEQPNEQKYFDLPEQFQLCQTPVKNEYMENEYENENAFLENEFVELNDLLNPVDNGNHGDNFAAGELSYYDAPDDPQVVSESEMNDFVNRVEADPSDFKMLDEYLKYFDATDDALDYAAFDYSTISDADDRIFPNLDYAAFDYSTISDADDRIFPNSAFAEVNRESEQAYLSFPGPSTIHGDEGASCSKQKSEVKKVVQPDVQYDGWDSTLAKQVTRMLGSISAPPAFAAEFPTKEAALGQNSSAQSSSSIHVTAGMIHISGMTVGGNGKNWSVGKSGDVDFLFPYSLTRGDVMTVENLIRGSFEPTNSMVLGKAGSVMARSTMYLIFLWVMIFSASYKIGTFIYAR